MCHILENVNLPESISCNEWIVIFWVYPKYASYAVLLMNNDTKLLFLPQYLWLQCVIYSLFFYFLYPANLVTCFVLLNTNFLRKPWPHTSKIYVVWCNKHHYRPYYDIYSYRNHIKLLPYDELKHECLRYESTLRSCKLRGNLPNLVLLLLFLTNVVESHSITQWQVI